MLKGGGGIVAACCISSLTNARKTIRYLMTGVKQSLYHSINGKPHGSGLIWALQSIYRLSSAFVRINEAYTDWFDIRRGVRQECIASPWLFNLFMDSCLHDLKEYECGLRMELSVKCLLYADNQVTNLKTIWYAERSLAVREYKNCSQYCACVGYFTMRQKVVSLFPVSGRGGPLTQLKDRDAALISGPCAPAHPSEAQAAARSCCVPASRPNI
ncbi:hypothetical protein EVAR_44147_1 [Eumeta japonica]|uniref:Reverse transcriptase domain-containing protein n=1 Tax=Eumeta variegata TaxID=151549 RepID=A0A4C1XNC1_EUMVA|nr:hypothetical protein EVAR_44147_1 [Eumeta japonica]